MPGFFGIHGISRLLEGESGAFSIVFGAFTLWMLIECLRKDPEKNLWLWIILFVPGFGAIAYFFVRWIPSRQLRPPGWLRGLTRGSEIRRLESAARQIGNPYQHVQLGEALRETGQIERAGEAYSRALEKEPGNLTALWGAGLVELHFKSFDTARDCFERVLQHDPQFKFGDASLAYAKTLISLQRIDEATAHLEKHVKRWRNPEGLYLLAELHTQGGRYEEARAHLESMLLEIDASPLSIARKQGPWRRRGRQLLRKLKSSR